MTRRVAPVLAAITLLVAACSGSAASVAPTTAPGVAPAPSVAAAASAPAPSADPSAAPSEAPPSPATSAAASEAAGAGGGGGGCEVSEEAGTVTVIIAGRAFGPSTVEAGVGEVITWSNRDPVPHTATLVEGDCTTEPIRAGSASLVFSEAGSYEYFCRIHPDMTGTIEIS
jgi:plastocyanin